MRIGGGFYNDDFVEEASRGRDTGVGQEGGL